MQLSVHPPLKGASHTFQVGVSDEGEINYQTKHMAAGRYAIELSYVMPDNKTMYTTDDGDNVMFAKYIMSEAGTVECGTIYGAKFTQLSAEDGARSLARAACACPCGAGTTSGLARVRSACACSCGAGATSGLARLQRDGGLLMQTCARTRACAAACLPGLVAGCEKLMSDTSCVVARSGHAVLLLWCITSSNTSYVVAQSDHAVFPLRCDRSSSRSSAHRTARQGYR